MFAFHVTVAEPPPDGGGRCAPTGREGNRWIKASRVVGIVAVSPTVDLEIDGLTSRDGCRHVVVEPRRVAVGYGLLPENGAAFTNRNRDPSSLNRC